MLILVSALAQGQVIGLSAKTEKPQYRIGDWIDVVIDGRVDVPVDSIRPALPDSLGLFEVLGAKREGNENRWTIRLSTLDSGRVILPPIPFVYRLKGDTAFQRAYSNSLTFLISGMAIDTKGEIKDIKPPMSGPWSFEDLLPYLIALVLIAGLSAAGYYYYRRRKRLASLAVEEARPAVPAHTEALTALRIVEEKKLWQQGKTKEFYSEVTEIIRRFFERRWNIVALELTSGEILAQMDRIPDGDPVRSEMVTFFRTADLVKFAKHQPTPEECTNELRWAYEIVRVMVPRAVVEAVPPEEAVDAR